MSQEVSQVNESKEINPLELYLQKRQEIKDKTNELLGYVKAVIDDFVKRLGEEVIDSEYSVIYPESVRVRLYVRSDNLDSVKRVTGVESLKGKIGNYYVAMRSYDYHEDGTKFVIVFSKNENIAGNYAYDP